MRALSEPLEGHIERLGNDRRFVEHPGVFHPPLSRQSGREIHEDGVITQLIDEDEWRMFGGGVESPDAPS